MSVTTSLFACGLTTFPGLVSLIFSVCSINDKQTKAQLNRNWAGKEPCLATCPWGTPEGKGKNLIFKPTIWTNWECILSILRVYVCVRGCVRLLQHQRSQWVVLVVLFSSSAWWIQLLWIKSKGVAIFPDRTDWVSVTVISPFFWVEGASVHRLRQFVFHNHYNCDRKHPSLPLRVAYSQISSLSSMTAICLQDACYPERCCLK